MKFGYRLVDRYPSPFTNTDTRGTINFGRNFTNNPVTNTRRLGDRLAAARLHQQRGRAASCSSRTRSARRNTACSSRTTSRPARGSPINAGLRYEIFSAETEEDNKIVNFDPVNLRLIYAGEDGASRR